jgi:hypothetical protein
MLIGEARYGSGESHVSGTLLIDIWSILNVTVQKIYKLISNMIKLLQLTEKSTECCCRDNSSICGTTVGAKVGSALGLNILQCSIDSV